MAIFKELAGQTSQGIDGLNRVITINYNELTANAPTDAISSQDFDFGVIKGGRITKAIGVTRGLRFTAGHANSGDGAGLVAPATVTFSIGYVGVPDHYIAATQLYVASTDAAASGTIVEATTESNPISFGNTAKLRLQFKTAANNQDLNTASAGKIYIFLSLVEWKDLDTFSRYFPS